ncbi:hypothetical protein [Fibrella aquatica]|jgi:hypothetical protein|uniref:hypothetical protein n=1 Tax=Fibrella aquatica TaxID=3242487 RepID=UPI003522A37F
MNAIRQIVTPDSSGNVSIQVPVELRQRPVEVIVLPVETSDDAMESVLTGSNAVSNAWKVIRKAQLDSALQQSIATLQQEAAQNGMTPDVLNELLRTDD